MTYKEEIIWLAGLIDGEGCIHMGKIGTRGKDRRRTPLYIIHITVDMTHKITVEKVAKILRNICQNVVKVNSYRSSQNNRKQKWSIRINRKSCVKKILEALLPFSLTKKKEIETTLEYLKLPLCKGGPKRFVPNNLVIQREYYYNRLKNLKIHHSDGTLENDHLTLCKI